MDNSPFLASISGLLLVVVYIGSLGSNDMNVFGSVSDDADNAAEQPVQQTRSNNGTTGAAKDVFDTHAFNAGGSAQNLFILIPNEGHHGPGEEDEARYLNQPFGQKR